MGRIVRAALVAAMALIAGACAGERDREPGRAPGIETPSTPAGATPGAGSPTGGSPDGGYGGYG